LLLSSQLLLSLPFLLPSFLQFAVYLHF